MTDPTAEYRGRYERHLQRVASNLETLIRGHLATVPRIDRITARAKTPSSFAGKATKRNDGTSRYAAPLTEIQDQLGVRVVVFYLSDVEMVLAEVRRYLRPIEDQLRVPE